jgi:prophage regulatory protein
MQGHANRPQTFINQFLNADEETVKNHVELCQRILRVAEVELLTGVPKGTRYTREKAGTFPKKIKIGPKAVGYRGSDIEQFFKDPAGYQQG